MKKIEKFSVGLLGAYALFHLFLGKSGMITPESVEQATEIVHWHLLEAKRILGPTEHQEKNKDAKRMIAWLKSKNITQTSSRQLQQTAGFRDKAKREEAIQLLIEHNYLAEVSKNGSKILFVNPM